MMTVAYRSSPPRRLTRAALAGSVGLTLALVLCPVAAFAQAADGEGLEEITVTAQRRTESIQSVPIPISALNGEQIERQQVRGIDDVLGQMPNVSFVSQGSRDRKEIALRGVSNQLDPYREGRQQAYAFYIDEFNVAVGTSNPEILDLDRIEVLRGPQGTYFGRNSVGGAINITTKKPTNDWFGELGAGYSNFDSKRVHGIINVPLIKDVLAIRASGQYSKTDGYIHNINPIGGGNDGNFRAGRVTVRFTPTDRITWDTTYSYMRGREGMLAGVPTGFNTATWADVYYGKAPGFIADPDGVGFYPENTNKVNFNRPQAVGTKFEYVSSHFAYDFDNMTLTAVGGTLSNHIYNKGDIDGGSTDAFYENRLIHRKSTSGELRLQSKGEQTIEWSVGANIGHDEGHLDARTYHGADSPLGGPEGLEVTGAFTDTDTDYWALFGQATWNVSDRLKVIVGGRYSHEKVKTVGSTRSNLTVTGTNDRSASFNDFSPKLTVSYDLPDAGMFYATVSRGFKAGGVQATGSSAVRNDFKPETLWNYEAGWKAELFDRRLRVDLAAFYMDWKDVQQYIRYQFIDATGLLRSVTAIDNAASASSKGVELSVDALIAKGLRTGGSVGYLDAKYDDYKNALIDGSVVDASGKPLINAPKWTISGYAEYSRPLFADSEGFVRAEWTHRTKQLTSTLALKYDFWPLVTPSYDVVNLRAGISNDRWSVTAYVENLFKKQYFSSSYEQAFYSGVQVEPSVRTYGLDFRVRFGRDGK